MDMLEFEADRTIEPGQLDIECVKQADLLFKWAERSVAAKNQADIVEAELKALEADLQLDCRQDPDKYGLSTATEAGVKAAVLACKKYRDKQMEHFKAQREANMLQQAVASMNQKKSMLDNLVKLFGDEYFAGPSVPRSIVEAWNAARRGRENALNQSQLATARKRVSRREDDDG